MVRHLSEAFLHPRHHGVFEIGTYWGTSSLRLAHALRAGTGTSSPRGFGATVTTVELDPVHVAVARVLQLGWGSSCVGVGSGGVRPMVGGLSSIYTAISAVVLVRGPWKML